MATEPAVALYNRDSVILFDHLKWKIILFVYNLYFSWQDYRDLMLIKNIKTVEFMEVSMTMEMFSHIVHGSFMKTEMVSFESIIQEKAILKGKKNLLIHFTSMAHQNLSCDF